MLVFVLLCALRQREGWIQLPHSTKQMHFQMDPQSRDDAAAFCKELGNPNEKKPFPLSPSTTQLVSIRSQDEFDFIMSDTGDSETTLMAPGWMNFSDFPNSCNNPNDYTASNDCIGFEPGATAIWTSCRRGKEGLFLNADGSSCTKGNPEGFAAWVSFKRREMRKEKKEKMVNGRV